MKKTVFLVFSLVLLLVVIGCAPAPAPVFITSIPSPLPSTSTPVPSPAPTVIREPLSILVSPFYYSDGVEVHVGDFSEQLATRDLQELTALAEVMAQQKAELTPEQMFVLAIRLYDLGGKDNAVYWFYEAQFRAKLFRITLDPAHIGTAGDVSYELLLDYEAFTKSAGEFINGYAGCDVDNWVKIANLVKNDNSQPPELDKLFPGAIFVENSQWQMINNDVAAGLGVLIEQLVAQKDAIRQQRVANNTDARFCD